MKTRVVFCRVGAFSWFVDVFVNGGWKNHSCHRTEDEAKQMARVVR